MIKLGEDIINMYKPYRNADAKWKTMMIAKQKFEINDRYDITAVRTILFMQSVKAPMES
jgi:hypothetical protein